MLALYDSMEAAAQTVSTIIANRVIPATLEFLDQPTLKVVEEFSKIGLPTDVEAVLLIEQDGPIQSVQTDMDKIATICVQSGALKVDVAKSEFEAEQLSTESRVELPADLATPTPSSNF